MAHIKKMVMQGFKSFAKKTEIPFDQGINVIIGANGSGKSNVSDSLCFALGRLSIKSMRAAKASNLLFMGSKFSKPAKEAYVELIFDNSDKAFSIDHPEISLKRIVRRNGQSVYKINGDTKTRGEVVETLAQAGIDPHGFNLILQGQIQSIVKMHPEERRKIIEEVAGIAIYESRKEKSLKELGKTEEKLKEISTVLKERTAYLNNLDRERSQALRFKELENIIRRCKASILSKKISEKRKEIGSIDLSIEKDLNEKDKVKSGSMEMGQEIESMGEEIQKINKHIQISTGVEQDKLHSDIANLKAELEGLRVRREGYENRMEDVERRVEEVSNGIPEMEEEIRNLRAESPKMAVKAEELKKKKDELEKIGEERKTLLTLRSDLRSLGERIKDKETAVGKIIGENESTLRHIEESSEGLEHESRSACESALVELRKELENTSGEYSELHNEELGHEKTLSVSTAEIERLEKIKTDVSDIDVCPLCQNKITDKHTQHVSLEANDRIGRHAESLKVAENAVKLTREKQEGLLKKIKSFEEKISRREIELVKQDSIEEKKGLLRRLIEDEKVLKEDLSVLEEKKKTLENKSIDLPGIEQKYSTKMLEIEEISSRTEEDVNTSLLYKERELENTRNIIKSSKADLEDIEITISELSGNLEDKSRALEEKEDQEKKLNEKFQQMFDQRDSLQKKIQEKNLELSEKQNSARQIEEQINYLKIGKAKLDAEMEALEMDNSDYSGLELLQGSVQVLEERYRKSKESLEKIGSINMRALEVYEDVKKEYDIVYQKVETLDKEKNDVLRIIEEIDKKKKKEFMKSFKAINELFTQNFGKLYTKGAAYLELENRESIFEGGVNIVVKLAKGKYFDVTSLSGGEQTLVALSLLFAVQEHKPYHFYVFDEIDAALDKRNSERLSGLLKQYMTSGQYIVITHNDAIITDSNTLYGVSMQEGVSKVLSLKIGEEAEKNLE